MSRQPLRPQVVRSALQAAAPRTASGKPVPSPCISVCSMDATRGLCSGCLRTLDEIAAWSTLDDAAKLAVWRRLAARRVEARRAAAEAAQAAEIAKGPLPGPGSP